MTHAGETVNFPHELAIPHAHTAYTGIGGMRHGEGRPTPPKASPPKPSTRWTFTVEAVGDGPPTVVRVRRMLKSAWRAYGLRCVTLAEVPHKVVDQVVDTQRPELAIKLKPLLAAKAKENQKAGGNSAEASPTRNAVVGQKAISSVSAFNGGAVLGNIATYNDVAT